MSEQKPLPPFRQVKGGTCSLCYGSGHLAAFPERKVEFWACPACGGAGTRALFSAPTIHSHAKETAP